MDRNRLAWGAIAGPVAFVAVWGAGGFIQEGYSPVHDTISELAAVGASTRIAMTVGLVSLGAGMVAFAGAIRGADGHVWLAATVTGLATLGVAATPLDWMPAVDRLHSAFAGIGYATLVAIPLLAAGRRERRPLARVSRAVGVVAGTCLAVSVLDLFAPGLLQRAGLTLVHAWVVATAASVIRDRLPRSSGILQRRPPQ